MAEAQDVETLKRRGRRRLVGAVALVLLAVIVLPMVFDPEPRQSAAPVSVRIPGEDETPFKPSVTPKAPQQAVEEKPASPQATPEASKAEAPQPEPVAAQAPKDEPRKAEAKKGEYSVAVGAFSNPDGVVAKLRGAKIPYYTESLKGSLTRVRAGPFASRESAENALQQLKGLGLKPGTVAPKS